MAQQRDRDEILEQMWMLEEDGENTVKDAVGFESQSESTDSLLSALANDGLVEIENDHVRLTGAGREAAEQIVRRHRLAERLLTDVIEVKEDETETSACQFEHILSPEVTESICTLLGHPLTCPHGKSIPPGECCVQARENVRPVVMPLSVLRSGDEGKVAYIATHHHHRLDKLASMGLVPGVSIRLHQRQPSFVIQMGETELAVDQDVANDIYVRRSSEEEGNRYGFKDDADRGRGRARASRGDRRAMRHRRARHGPPDG